MKINIQISPNVTETLLVYEGETAEHVSKAFAMRLGLNESVESLLKDQISMNMSKVEHS